MQIHEQLRAMRLAAGLTQAELATRLNTNLHWVSKREIAETRALHPDDLAEWAEACGYRLDLAFVVEGQTVDRSTRPPEAIQAAELLLDAWDRMSPDARRMLLSVLKSAGGQESGLSGRPGEGANR